MVGRVLAEQEADDEQVDVAVRGVQQAAAGAADVGGEGVVVDVHREAAVDGDPGARLAEQLVLVEVPLVGRQQQHPVAREGAEQADAAERGDREADRGAGEPLGVAVKDGVELGVVVVALGAGELRLVGEDGAGEQRGVVGVGGGVGGGDGDEALEQLAPADDEGVLRDAVEEVVGDHDQAAGERPGAESRAGDVEAQVPVVLDVEAGEVEDAALDEGPQLRVRAPVLDVAGGEVGHDVAQREPGAAQQLGEAPEEQVGEAARSGAEFDDVERPPSIVRRPVSVARPAAVSFSPISTSPVTRTTQPRPAASASESRIMSPSWIFSGPHGGHRSGGSPVVGTLDDSPLVDSVPLVDEVSLADVCTSSPVCGLQPASTTSAPIHDSPAVVIGRSYPFS